MCVVVQISFLIYYLFTIYLLVVYYLCTMYLNSHGGSGIAKDAKAKRHAGTAGFIHYGVATISRLLKIIGLFCKRAL